MLIALPNRDGSFTATLFLPRRGSVSFEALSTGPLVRRLFDEVFPDASAAMPKLEPDFSEHPQGRLGTVFCDRWHDSGQALLLGDAAHAIVPFHGQGLNCGFEDCTVLDELASAGGSLNEVFAEFERQRRPNTDAIASMALDNYLEMRSGVRTPEFAERKILAQSLERLFPSRFIPRYSMVMFHPEIPYATARRRGELQERVLDRLLSASQLHTRSTDVERVLDEFGL
jgi:kynurenine 3-monooxygenase